MAQLVAELVSASSDNDKTAGTYHNISTPVNFLLVADPSIHLVPVVDTRIFCPWHVLFLKVYPAVLVPITHESSCDLSASLQAALGIIQPGRRAEIDKSIA